jgi:hypothetical protein
MAAREPIDVSEVVELTSDRWGYGPERTKQINKYLAAGWRLLDTYVVGYGDRERHETHYYVLGWPTTLTTKPAHFEQESRGRMTLEPIGEGQ